MDMSLAEKIDAVKQETGRGIPTRLGEHKIVISLRRLLRITTLRRN